MFGKLKSIWKRLFYEDYWVVGITQNDSLTNLSGTVTIPDNKIKWLNGRSSYFLADPYWLDESKRIIICECFYYNDKIGRLAVVYLNKDWSIKKMKMVNSKSAHYSYPHVIRANGKCYVIPESAFDKYLKLLEIDEATHQVVKEHVLIADCQLVDPTIFFHDNKYWMFANPLEDFNNSLFIYYADQIEGPWIPTGISPLSIKNCRGAGSIYFKNGSFYWPAQYNETEYGGGIIIRKITNLDKDLFTYETEAMLKPDENSRYPVGLHTLNIGMNSTLIDGKNYSFHFLKPFRALFFRLKNMSKG